MTFVRTKLLLERMAAGEIAEVRLRAGEPLRNVPRSVTELGHQVVELVPEDDQADTGRSASDTGSQIYRLRIRKS